MHATPPARYPLRHHVDRVVHAQLGVLLEQRLCPSCAETRPTTTSAPAGVRQCTPYPARAALAGAREALLTTRWTPPRNGSRDLGPLFARLHGPSHAFRQTMVSARRGASLHVPGRGRPEARRGGPTAGAAPPLGEPMGDTQLRKQGFALRTGFGTTACDPRGFAGGSLCGRGIARRPPGQPPRARVAR